MADFKKVSLNKKDGKVVKRKIKVPECKAIILHPSLGCPLIVEKGKPIRIYIMADKNFNLIFNAQRYGFQRSNPEFKEDKYKDSKDLSGYNSSPEMRRTIARYLKISTFRAALEGKDSNTKNDKPIFTPEDAVKNIAIKLNSYYHARKTLFDYGNSEKNGLEKGGLELEYFEAEISNIARRHYAEKECTTLYQIDIHNFEFDKIIDDSKGHSMFEVSWVSSDPELNLHDNSLLERQDQYTNEFIKNKKYIKDTDLTHAFKITDDFKCEVDKNQPIQNYHPIYLREDNKPLSIGQLTDVHVSSRQQAFTKSNAELIHGSNTNVIGPLVNTSYATLKDLMDQFGKDDKIDLLFFTGDLIDYNRNYHPKKFMDGTLSKTGDIWKEMLFENMNQRDGKNAPLKDKDDNILPNNDDYPSSIDNVIIYSLFLYYIQKYQKPIFLISGNHECYTLPYGISPRVSSGRGVWKATTTWARQSLETQIEDSQTDLKNDMKKEVKTGTVEGNRANTGVPADHNLTFGEATLMYGPSYHQNIMFGKGDSANTRNYKPKNLDWFDIVFNPLSDYVFTWGKQAFISLEWGAGERMVVLSDSQRDGAGGILPRATESISTRQWQLVKRAVGLNKPCTILLTHFTIVNYDQFQAIDNNPGLIDIDNWGDKHGQFDYGSFEKRREFVYQFIADNKIHYSLAGHSHRSALYQHTKMSKSYLRKKFEVDARTANYETKIFDKYDKNKAKIIISASGGSIPIQNFNHELAGWGLALPSGSYIYFDKASGKELEIGIKTSKVKSAKPRLAVSLDFADVIGGEDDDKGGFFKRLESTRDDGPIYFDINPEYKFPDSEWIGEVIFYVYNGNEHTAYPSSIKYCGNHKYELTTSNTKALIKATKDNKLIFISIKSNGSLNGKVFSHYNQDSPWQFRIKLITRMDRFLEFKKIYTRKGGSAVIEKGRERGNDVLASIMKMQKEDKVNGLEGLFIERHDSFGETPNHQEYTDIFTNKNEYKYDWETEEKTGDTK